MMKEKYTYREELNVVSENIQDEKVEGVFRVFKGRILGVVRPLVGTKVMKVRKRKRKPW